VAAQGGVEPATGGEAPAPKRRDVGLWAGLAGGAVVLAALITFIAQNRSEARVHFLVWRGTLGLGWSLLLAAAIGGLVVAVVAGMRARQQKREMARRHQEELAAAGVRTETRPRGLFARLRSSE
jgi:uncharacterized integral membrane protein